MLELERHPESRTPPADEVRLALHAAAAQLLDPGARAALIEHWKDASNGAWSEQVALSPLASTIGTPARLALEGDAIMAMALEGGWNARSLERLMVFAHARGLTADDVAQAVQRLSQPSGGAPARPAPAPRAPVPAPFPPADEPARGPGFRVPAAPVAPPAPPPRPRTFELTEEELRRQSAQRLRLAMTGIGCGSVVLFAVTLGVIVAFRTTPAAPPLDPARPPDAAADVSPKPKPPAAGTPQNPAVPKDLTAADDVARLLTNAAGQAREKPAESAKLFATAVAQAGRNWSRWKPDELIIVQDGVIEYLYRASRDGEAVRAAAEAVAGPVRSAAAAKLLGPDEVSAAVWSVGLCTRILRERDLPATVTSPARLAAAEFVGSEADLADGTFGGGVSRALTAAVPRLVLAPTPEAWKVWLAMVTASAPEVPARGRLIIAALDAMLASRENPLEEPRAVESIAELAASLSWRPEEQSRGWMFRWFDSASVSTPALHALTSALAARSGAEGIDSSMVLSAAASPGQRAELRARFAKAWTDAPGGVRSDLLAKWHAAAVKELEPGVDGSANAAGGDLAPRLVALVDAIASSRLSEAAAWINVGDASRPGPIIADPDAGLTATAKIVGPSVDPLGGTNDGAWAIRYLSSLANGPLRLEMLKQAEAAPELTALECEVVATEAVRGLPASVRQAARKVVIRHHGLPGMLNAILNIAPALAPGPDNQTFMEEVLGVKLPSFRDSRWRESVRRQIVQQLLERAAGRGEYGAVDALAELLGKSYRDRIAALGGADGLQPAIDGPTLAKLAGVYHARWDREAERIPPSGKEHASLGQIRQRAAGRSGLSANVVQQFVAEQTASVELMAYVVVAEDPGRAQSVAEVIRVWTDGRRQSKHIFEQIRIAEQAMLKLWRIRMKEAVA